MHQYPEIYRVNNYTLPARPVYIQSKLDGDDIVIYYHNGEVKCNNELPSILEINEEALLNFFTRHKKYILYGVNFPEWGTVYIYDIYDTESGVFIEPDSAPIYNNILQLFPFIRLVPTLRFEKGITPSSQVSDFVVDYLQELEHIVIKDYTNQLFNYLPTNVFNILVTTSTEKDIVERYCTQELCEEEFGKLYVKQGSYDNSMRNTLFNSIFNTIIKNHSLDIIEHYKFPKIDTFYLYKITIIQAQKHLINKIGE